MKKLTKKNGNHPGKGNHGKHDWDWKEMGTNQKYW
jgi:hypothetical protein